jgi:hypothetical protein
MPHLIEKKFCFANPMVVRVWGARVKKVCPNAKKSLVGKKS